MSIRLISISLVGALLSAPALAHDHLVIYGGGYDVLDSHTTVQAGAEYRWHGFGYHLRPTVGVNVDDQGAGYLYGGLNWELPVADSVYVSPSFMVGAYHEGDGKDLGGTLEFRSGIEVSYELADHGDRIGVQFNHISNASIYDQNPGAETLLLVYQRPFE